MPQDDAEAVTWLRMAAEQSYADAQVGLGLLYARGDSVPQDYVVARMWFNLAAAQGQKNAQEALDVTASLLTLDQIAEAHRLAREWMAKHQQ